MRFCPYCEDELQITDINVEGYDILGCLNCDYEENNTTIDDDIAYFI